jgi:tyrosyl-tRNA synthetase
MNFETELKINTKSTEEIIPLDELKGKLAKSAKTGKPLRIKYGIDPTGHEIHIGHLVPIRKMRDFQDLGHTGVIIIGDFTAQIGDPTGRDNPAHPSPTSRSRSTARSIWNSCLPSQAGTDRNPLSKRVVWEDGDVGSIEASG